MSDGEGRGGEGKEGVDSMYWCRQADRQTDRPSLPQVYSLGAFTSGGELLGMIIGELQPLGRLEGEVGVVLERSSPDTKALYIVSLGQSQSQPHAASGGPVTVPCSGGSVSVPVLCS